MPAPSKTPHPESLNPRVFVQFWTLTESWENPKKALKVFELLRDGQAIEWSEPPIPEDGFRFWNVDLPGLDSTLTNINFVRPPGDLPALAPKKVPQEVIDQLKAAGLKVGEDGNIESDSKS